ncbi:MAG: thioesterase, FlK family, partial [Planctomycetaceae bacterium]
QNGLPTESVRKMKNGLQTGSRGELQWTVDAERVITLGGDARATVFSTPNMILLMERAAREALRPFLDAGEESVGIDVNIRHLAGAGYGAHVRGVAVVREIDGRRIGFDVECWCGDRLLGQGTHWRAVVSVEKLVQNIARLNQNQHAGNLNPAPGTLPEFQTLKVRISQQIATVTLSRPASLNAVNVRMTSELEQLVAWLAAHPQEVRVVLLTGEGAAFCAGDDVIELPSLDTETARQLSLRQASVYLAFERLPQPVIALVNGDAFGAGCVAACAADLRIAAHNAKLGMPEICLGWPPGYGLAQLTALVGKSRALELCLTGQPISARTALEWGLVGEVVSGSRLTTRGHEIAARLLQMPAEALRETKRLIHLDEGTQPKVAHHADTEAYIRCLQLPDAGEGLRAFAEKRPPRFTGN